MGFCRTMNMHDEIGILLLGVICAYTNRHARIVFKKTIAQNMGVASIFFFFWSAPKKFVFIWKATVQIKIY